MRIATILCALLIALNVAAQTAPLKYQELVMSDGQGGPATSAFKTTTDKIFVRGKLPGVPAGTKVRSEWIAVKARGVIPNFRIASYQMQLGPDTVNVEFTLSKPTAGWPDGDYRVDLLIDDKPAASLPFRIAK